MSSFVGRVAAEWIEAPREMRLLEPFGFIDPQGIEWTAPAGLVTDGASIPRSLWVIAGSPFVGQYRRAAVIHDHECQVRFRPSRAVHRMFYEAMRADGVGQDEATRMYAAVRLLGPSWPVGSPLMRGLASLPPALSVDAVEQALDQVLP
jgi:hypothetical protein